MSSITGETITAIDLTLVELLSSIYKKNKNSLFSKEDLAFQEARKKRKIKKLEFEIK